MRPDIALLVARDDLRRQARPTSRRRLGDRRRSRRFRFSNFADHRRAHPARGASDGVVLGEEAAVASKPANPGHDPRGIVAGVRRA
ncbi:hypothetical protein GTY63_25155 [Amycolatopsis rubida]|nr:hypothetical protein [Amycolatopsis rubida]